MRKLFETLDITYIPSSAHFPQSKSRIKTFNKCLKATLSALRLDSPELDLWTHLAKFLAVYNAQIHPHSQRGYSLSQLFFGGNHVNNSPQLQIAPPSLHFANKDAEFQTPARTTNPFLWFVFLPSHLNFPVLFTSRLHLFLLPSVFLSFLFSVTPSSFRSFFRLFPFTTFSFRLP